MIAVFLADGFEECEALAPVDILRRGGLTVKTVGVGAKTVTGSHGIPVVCDLTADELEESDLQAVILPGGMPGTRNLEKSEAVQRVIDRAAAENRILGAICAAPSILGHKNLLAGKKATCFPGFEQDLFGAELTDQPVVRDGNIITAHGAGAAFSFGFALLAAITGDKQQADALKREMKVTS